MWKRIQVTDATVAVGILIAAQRLLTLIGKSRLRWDKPDVGFIPGSRVSAGRSTRRASGAGTRLGGPSLHIQCAAVIGFEAAFISVLSPDATKFQVIGRLRSPLPDLSRRQRLHVLLAAFLAWMFAGLGIALFILIHRQMMAEFRRPAAQTRPKANCCRRRPETKLQWHSAIAHSFGGKSAGMTFFAIDSFASGILIGGNRFFGVRMIDLPQTRLSLVVRLRDPADSAAWHTFVDVYAPAVFAFARRGGLQAADAADLTQDVCRNVANAMRSSQYDADRGRFHGWLFAIVRNQLKMFRRAQSRRPRGADLPNEVPDDSAAENWDLECRRHLFAWACDNVKPAVKPNTWTAFWRTAVDGASAETVAKETGMTPAAVYLAKSRVLARLREAVSAVEDE